LSPGIRREQFRDLRKHGDTEDLGFAARDGIQPAATHLTMRERTTQPELDAPQIQALWPAIPLNMLGERFAEGEAKCLPIAGQHPDVVRRTTGDRTSIKGVNSYEPPYLAWENNLPLLVSGIV